MSLFVLASKDGWVNIMYNGLDAVAVDQQVGIAWAIADEDGGEGPEVTSGSWSPRIHQVRSGTRGGEEGQW